MTTYRTTAGDLAFDESITHVMGVINLSVDSKNAQTIARTPEEALALAERYRSAGASVVDVGAQSSHIDNPTIAAEHEIELLLPALDRLVDAGFIVSIDTWKPAVARVAVERGAAIVNDTGGLGDESMRRLLADTDAVGILMYLEGANPHDVGDIQVDENKAAVTADWMADRLRTLRTEGVERVILDPGIAINYRGDYQAYTQMQLDVIRHLDRLKVFGFPVMVPIPRKRADHQVVAYITLALEHEADLIRVHDVEWACDLVRLFGRAAR